MRICFSHGKSIHYLSAKLFCPFICDLLFFTYAKSVKQV